MNTTIDRLDIHGSADQPDDGSGGGAVGQKSARDQNDQPATTASDLEPEGHPS